MSKDNEIQSLKDKVYHDEEQLQSLHQKEKDISQEHIKTKKIHEMLYNKIEKAIKGEALLLKKVEDLQTKYTMSSEREIIGIKKLEDAESQIKQLTQKESNLLKNVKHLKLVNDKYFKNEKELKRSENELRLT